MVIRSCLSIRAHALPSFYITYSATALTEPQISEKEYRIQLRKAYLQLDSLKLGADAITAYMFGQVAAA